MNTTGLTEGITRDSRAHKHNISQRYNLWFAGSSGEPLRFYNLVVCATACGVNKMSSDGMNE